MVCLLRLNLYFRKLIRSWIFFQISAITTDLSNLNTILYNLHI
jgi:hypothetical protein